MSCVDWCDATAFCEWAGKRLCGSGSLDPIAFGEFATKKDEWFVACSHNDDGVHLYPYGPSFVHDACNAAGTGGTGLLPVASKVKCEGGYPGIFDMSGNIDEWENLCDESGSVDVQPKDVVCRVRGGSWYPPSDTAYLAQCNGDRGYARSGGAGIRCCSP